MKKVNRRTEWNCLVTSAALLVAATSTVWAQPATYTVERALELKEPTAAQRRTLARGADEYLREFIAERFAMASADFNDDGVDELVLSAQSLAHCGSAGCSTMVLQLRGDKWMDIGGMYSDGGLGLTREKVGGYRALAILDEKGAISRWDKDPALRGKKQNVALMKPPAGMPAATAPAPAAQATPAQPAAAAVGDAAPSVVGLRLGMPAAEAMSVLQKHAAKYGPRMRVTKQSFRSKCASCQPYEALYYAGMPLPNREPGPVRTDAITVFVSPPSLGSKVVAVEREIHLKEPIAPETVVGQIESKHGKPSADEYGALVWYFDANRDRVVAARLPRHGDVSRRCSTVPSQSFSWATEVESLLNAAAANDLRSKGEWNSISVQCGNLLTIRHNAQGAQGVTFIKSLLIDHGASAEAGLHGHAMLSAQQAAVDAQRDRALRVRPAPQIN